jgi:chromosomal replication initiation ATPase DnaA
MSDRNAVTNAVTNASSNGAQTSPVVTSNEVTTKRTSSPAIPSPDEINAEAQARLRAEIAQTRLESFLSRRPAKLSAPGALDARLIAWARGVFEGKTGNLVITGNTGTGKSWSAWRIGEELLRRGWPGRIEITSAYRIKQLAAPPADMDEIARLGSVELLALDDIGAVRVSDWDADHLYALVDERWANERPTIVITNATKAPEAGKTLLDSLLGERVASRIRDGVTVVPVTGSDRRRAS